MIWLIDMVMVKLTNEMIDYAMQLNREVLKRRDRQNRQGRYKQNNITNDIYGIVGKLTVLQWLNMPFEILEKTFYIPERVYYDFIFNDYKCIVKTMTRTCDVKPYYDCNFVKNQVDVDYDIVIFVSINKLKNIAVICGWMYKDQFKKSASVAVTGERQGVVTFRADNLAVQVQLLTHINNLRTIYNPKMQLKLF